MIEKTTAFRRERMSRWRRRLRESDALFDLIEECRVRGLQLLPTKVWSAVVRFVGKVDDELRDHLGINRHLDHVSEVLFLAQEQLLIDTLRQRQPQLAPIIQLFPRKKSPSR